MGSEKRKEQAKEANERSLSNHVPKELPKQFNLICFVQIVPPGVKMIWYASVRHKLHTFKVGLKEGQNVPAGIMLDIPINESAHGWIVWRLFAFRFGYQIGVCCTLS